jgi:hypothetical protein
VLVATVIGATLAVTASSAAAILPAPRQVVRVAGTEVQLPPANGRFDYQLGGAYKPIRSVRIVDRDRTSKPAPGVYDICYINAFQTQADEDGWWKRNHPKLLLRNVHHALIEDPGWPGEIILDTSTSAKRHALAKIEDRWLRGCRHKGFRAVEPDNLDSNTRSHGLLTQSDDFALAKLLVTEAHGDGLAVAQKNDAEQSAHLRRTVHFDFAIAEECQVYDECSFYTKTYRAEVFEIEYTDNGRAAYATACARRGAEISVILRDRNVVPRGAKGYVYKSC